MFDDEEGGLAKIRKLIYIEMIISKDIQHKIR